MKTIKNIILIALTTACLLPLNATAQEEKESPFSLGADMVSRYIFRGLDFGSSPAIQPSLEYSKSNFTIGMWGSYSLLATPPGIEVDLYANYEFDFGLSLGVTDYYFPGERLKISADSTITSIRTGKYFDYRNFHLFELNISQSIGNLSLAANWNFYNLNNALYFEVNYGFKYFSVFVGAGNEIYTINKNFNVVNLGLSASKDIKITENYALPISASVILNPNVEQIHLVFIVSL